MGDAQGAAAAADNTAPRRTMDAGRDVAAEAIQAPPADGPCEICGAPGWAEADPDDPAWRPIRCGPHTRDAAYS